jgi:UDPglucose 6-dehydrogenase
VLSINEATTESLVRILATYLGNLEKKDILILGYTYKAETDTLRRSPALDLAKGLIKGGALVSGFDPMMNQQDLTAMEGLIQHYFQWDQITATPDAVIIMTARREFSSLNWKFLNCLTPASSGKRPLLFDTQNLISAESALASGFAFKALWQPIHANAYKESLSSVRDASQQNIPPL